MMVSLQKELGAIPLRAHGLRVRLITRQDAAVWWDDKVKRRAGVIGQTGRAGVVASSCSTNAAREDEKRMNAPAALPQA